MPPDAEDPPAGAAEGAVDEKVAGLVAGDLGLPELRVGLGLRGVDRAAVLLKIVLLPKGNCAKA
jgi:hypothetical protein